MSQGPAPREPRPLGSSLLSLSCLPPPTSRPAPLLLPPHLFFPGTPAASGCLSPKPAGPPGLAGGQDSQPGPPPCCPFRVPRAGVELLPLSFPDLPESWVFVRPWARRRSSSADWSPRSHVLGGAGGAFLAPPHLLPAGLRGTLLPHPSSWPRTRAHRGLHFRGLTVAPTGRQGGLVLSVAL